MRRRRGEFVRSSKTPDFFVASTLFRREPQYPRDGYSTPIAPLSQRHRGRAGQAGRVPQDGYCDESKTWQLPVLRALTRDYEAFVADGTAALCGMFKAVDESVGQPGRSDHEKKVESPAHLNNRWCMETFRCAIFE